MPTNSFCCCACNNGRWANGTDVTSDNNYEESSEEPGLSKRPSQSEVFAVLDFLQN